MKAKLYHWPICLVVLDNSLIIHEYVHLGGKTPGEAVKPNGSIYLIYTLHSFRNFSDTISAIIESQYNRECRKPSNLDPRSRIFIIIIAVVDKSMRQKIRHIFFDSVHYKCLLYVIIVSFVHRNKR